MNPNNLIDRAMDRLVVYFRKTIKVGLWLLISRRFRVIALITVVLWSTRWLDRFEQVPWSQIVNLLR